MTIKEIPKEYLDTQEKFYIETTSNEKFEVTKLAEGYLLTDIIPPRLEIPINSYLTYILAKNEINKTKRNSDAFLLKDYLYFEGIVKRGFLSFIKKENGESLLTKGRIEKLYLLNDARSFQLKIHLFEQPGKKIPWEELLNINFKILTPEGMHAFTQEKNGLIFEGNKVLAVYSLFNTRAKNVLSLEKTIDVNFHFLHLNRPFAVLSLKEGNPHLSLIMEDVLTVQKEC